MAIYLPVFLVGWFIPAFSGNEPDTWAVTSVVALFVTAWIVVAIGLLVVWVTSRHRPAPAST